jgi:putative phosphoesterase
MLIAVVSDTHGQVEYTLAAVREIERRQPAVVLHCGDIGSPAIVPLFMGRDTHFVFGNVDDPSLLRASITDAGLTCDELFGEIELEGRRIALLHGHDELLLRQTIRGGEYDLVCHGHTHRRRWERVGSTWVLNPGAIFRASPHSMTFVTLPDLSAEFVTLPVERS